MFWSDDFFHGDDFMDGDHPEEWLCKAYMCTMVMANQYKYM